MSPALHFDPNCDFCAITQGGAGTTPIVWEDETWLAFFPLKPATPGHTLVVPRTHVANLWAVQAPLDAQLMQAAILVGRAIRSALKPDGLNLITSSGRSAEQTVFHTHLHVLPRWENDGFDDIWDSQASTDTPSDWDDTAARVHEALLHQEDQHD